jgi:hypothetical protein
LIVYGCTSKNELKLIVGWPKINFFFALLLYRTISSEIKREPKERNEEEKERGGS